VRVYRTKVVRRITRRVSFGKRIYRRILVIRRRIQRTQKVFKKVKNPSQVVNKVYQKKVRALKEVMKRLMTAGRKTCNIRKNIVDVKKSSATIVKSL
jgi:hypothetical protein